MNGGPGRQEDRELKLNGFNDEAGKLKLNPLNTTA
jgi:hypothetical protein